mmetsp:Transcript_39062/g.69963  ORF Transcript_39062/g.69963 Transcript_39062/m.69963 type:complete len:207 (-) Transcript_39062:1545-2165(-)
MHKRMTFLSTWDEGRFGLLCFFLLDVTLTNRASSLDDQPLVNAVLVILVVAGQRAKHLARLWLFQAHHAALGGAGGGLGGGGHHRLCRQLVDHTLSRTLAVLHALIQSEQSLVVVLIEISVAEKHVRRQPALAHLADGLDLVGQVLQLLHGGKGAPKEQVSKAGGRERCRGLVTAVPGVAAAGEVGVTRSRVAHHGLPQLIPQLLP